MLLKHQEAMDVSLKLRWDDIGIPLIDVLSSRDPLFAVELSCYRYVPDDPDDALQKRLVGNARCNWSSILPKLW